MVEDVRFKSDSGNMANSCIRNASGHNDRDSSVIMDLAMGQIPRSAECISSYYYYCNYIIIIIIIITYFNTIYRLHFLIFPSQMSQAVKNTSF